MDEQREATPPVTIFYSYAREDESLRNELEKYLSSLKRKGLIAGWHDRNISAGTDWAREIDMHLNRAHIILLLVSPSFVASDYCYNVEMKRALERHEAGEALVIPVILRPADWESTPFGQLKALPKDGKAVVRWRLRDDAFLDIVRGIRNVIEELNLPSSIASVSASMKTTSPRQGNAIRQPIPPCPYRGLSAFREQDTPYFYGRETFTAQLVASVRRKPLVSVIGPSGGGKSSVVFAGLIPCLRREGNWLVASFRPSDHPFRTLAAALIPLLEPQMSETDRLMHINKLAEPLQQEELPVYDIVERILQKHCAAHLLLFADQFEELYTLCRKAEERQRFLDSLLRAMQRASQQQRPNFTFIITLRADFLGQVLLYRPFADALQYSDLKLSSMNRQELQDAIKKPAAQLDVQIEDGLTERILDAVSQEPGNLPLLEFALTLLWAKQREAILTHVAYDEIGGVEQSLATYTEETYAGLSKEEQQRAYRIFIQLVHPGRGTEDTRRIATRSQVGEEGWDLVTRLSDARLMVSGRDETTGEETVEVVHEALIGGWHRLREWMEKDHEFRLWQESIRMRMIEWTRTNRSQDELLRGFALAEAETWLLERSIELSRAEQDFIRASREQQAQEERREYERAKAQANELALREANRRMDEFLGLASHELRTPLEGIAGNLLLAMRQLKKSIHEDGTYADDLASELELVQNLLGKAERQVKLQGQLVYSMLEASRIQMERLYLQLEPVDLTVLVREVVQEERQRDSSRTIDLEMSPKKGAPVIVDADRIRQVVANYVINARNFSSPDQPITVTLQSEEHIVRVSVHDEGPGLSIEEQDHIWERFYKAHGIEGRREGLGLGLYICRAIIEQHQGKVGVLSAPEKGSTFWFTLPLAHKTQ